MGESNVLLRIVTNVDTPNEDGFIYVGWETAETMADNFLEAYPDALYIMLTGERNGRFVVQLWSRRS